MKYRLIYSSVLILLTALLYSCGPSAEEQQRREQARQDSLEQIRQDSLQRVRQQRQDSLAQARADSIKANQTSGTNIAFTDGGRYTLQLSSWRSRVKAQQRVNLWNKRGYKGHAYIVKHGNEQTGNVWFRVRIGQVDNRQEAQKLQQNLVDEHQTESWITIEN